MQYQVQNVCITDQITLDNTNKIAWGPNNFLAVASENIVTIYQLHNKKFDVFRKITKHKARITALSWNNPTVEFYKPNSFDILLAIGDDDGNCLIYDVFSLSRRGGISPESCSPSFSIFDIKWKLDDASTLFVLTAQPSLISICVGTAENLNLSKMKLLSINFASFHSINVSLLWAQNIELGYKSIAIDLYDANRILISSHQNFCFFAIKINKKNKPNHQNIHQNSVSDILKFPIDENLKLLNIEYFPFRPNCLLILTDQHLYLYNLYTKAISSIVSYNHIKPFCVCCGMFSHSISDRFWLATIDGSIYRSSITDPDEKNGGDQWAVDCLISSPKAQILLGIFSDYLNPTRICAVYKDGIAIINEFPNSIKINEINQHHNKSLTLNRSLSQGSNSGDKQLFYQILNQNSNQEITQSIYQSSNHFEKQNLYQVLNQDLIPNQDFDNENNFIINQKNKLFITSFLPCLTEQLISWSADKGRIAFLSSSGIITVLAPPFNPQSDEEENNEDHIFNYSNIENICYRYKINDPQTTQISFYKNDSIALNGSKFHILNYKQRGEIHHISKKVTKFCIKDDILAFTPTLSSFELYTINNSSFNKDFASNIKLFCPCYNDKTKWALLLSFPQNTLFVIGYVISKRFEIDENIYGSVVSIAFAYENIYLATSKSIIHLFNLSTGESKSIIFSKFSMRSISIYKDFLLACDMSNNCSILSAKDLSFVSTSSCFGKEIQMLNDNFCVVQVKSSQRPVLMLYKFPSLEPVRAITTTNSNNNTEKSTFYFPLSKLNTNYTSSNASLVNSNKNSNSSSLNLISTKPNHKDNLNTNASSSNNNNSNSNSINSNSNNTNSNSNTTNSNFDSVNSNTNTTNSYFDSTNSNTNTTNSNFDSADSNSTKLKPNFCSTNSTFNSDNLNNFNSNSNSFRDLFWQCKSIDEFEKVARQIGDLSFLQFVQVAKHEKDTILPNIYSITRNKSYENERCFGACNIRNSAFVDEYIEYLILSNQFERAAKYALNVVNKQNILLAHACLSPNAEAVKKIMQIIPSTKGSEKIFALLLKIAGDSEEAAKIAFKINDTLTSIKFLKMICDEDKIRRFIKNLKIYKENYLAMAFNNDYQNTFTILLNSNEISKAFAYMFLVDERINEYNSNNNSNNANKEEEAKMDHLLFNNLKIQIKSEWKRLMQK